MKVNASLSMKPVGSCSGVVTRKIGWNLLLGGIEPSPNTLLFLKVLILRDFIR